MRVRVEVGVMPRVEVGVEGVDVGGLGSGRGTGGGRWGGVGGAQGGRWGG